MVVFYSMTIWNQRVENRGRKKIDPSNAIFYFLLQIWEVTDIVVLKIIPIKKPEKNYKTEKDSKVAEILMYLSSG